MATVSELIAAEAARQGVDANLAIQVAAAESGLNPNVPDSYAGAIGVFQLEPATAAQLGVNPRDLGQNIAGGIRYLGQLLGKFGGSIPAALAAYNWGPGNLSSAMSRWGTDWVSHLPSETTAYVAKIIRNLGLSLPTSTVATPPAAPPDAGASTDHDQGAPAAAPSSDGTLVSILILTGLAVGVYIVAEVFSDG